MLRKSDLKILIPEYLQNSRNLLVCILDMDGYVHYLGENFRKVIEGSFHNLEEFNLMDTLQKNQITKFQNQLDDILESPSIVFQLDLIHNSFSANWEFSCLTNSEGDFSGILGIGVPTYELKSNKVYSSAVFGEINLQTDLVFTVNSNWRILHSDGNTGDLLKGNCEAVLGHSLWEVFRHPKIYEYALEFKKCKGDNSLHIFEDYITDLGKWFRIFINPTQIGMEILFKDISEIHALNNELKKSYLTLQSVLEHSDESIFLIGKDLKLTGFNEHASKLVRREFQKDMKVGDHFLKYLLPGLEEKFLVDLENAYAGKAVTFEKEILSNETDESLLFLHKFFPLIDSQDEVIGLVYSCRNIDFNKRELEELQARNQILRDAVQFQTCDLRAPLASILGLLELIDKNQLDAENQNFFKFLKSLSLQMDQVIRLNSQKVNHIL